MFTGALAVSYYGRARTTVDVDVVVAVFGRNWRSKLTSALRKAGLMVEEKRVDDALKSGYNIVSFRDGKSPLTVDIILSRERLKKQPGTILGLPTYYQTPEDLVLAKLRMIKATVPRERASKDEEDVKAILKFTGVNVDVVREQAKRDSTIRIFETLLNIDVRKVLERVKEKYGLKLPRKVVTVNYGDDVGDLFVRFRHLDHAEGEPTADGKVIVYYDKQGRMVAIEITNITTL